MKKGSEIRGVSAGRLPTCLRWCALGAILGIPWLVTSSDASVAIFLKLTETDPSLKGESTDKEHPGEIEVLSLSVGASKTPPLIGGGSTAANVTDLSLYKYLDNASPELLRRVMTGQHLDHAEIQIVEDFNQTERPVVKISLEDIIVTSHQSGSSLSQTKPTEKVSLNFAQFTFQTFSYAADGVPTDNPSMTWNIATNSPGSNSAPTITSIPPQSTAEDTPINVSFNVGDAESPTGSLTLSRSTTNPQVIPLSGIILGGSGSSRTVTITPAANANGSATIGITATDPEGLSSTRNFTVTVTPVSDAPVIQPVSDVVTTQDVPLVVNLNVTDVDTAATAVTVTPVSGNPALLPNANITFSGNGSATQMTLTPAAGTSGASLVTLTANDGTLNSAPVSFTLTVNPTGNTGPTDIQLSASSVPENSPTNTDIGTLVASDPDDGNNVTFSLVDSAGGRFKLASGDHIAVANGALLDFETAASHDIIVRATDPDLNTFDQTLTINLLNVNEPPIITTSPVPPISIDSVSPIPGISISDPDSGPLDITLTFQVTGGTLHFTDTGGLAGKVTGNDSASVSVTAPVALIDAALQSDGLTYSTSALAPGIHPLALLANDLGHSGSGSAQQSDTSIPIEVVASPFQQWRIDHFNAAELADPAISGPLADADQDGIGNLLEYGVDSDPNDPADGPGLVEIIQVDDGGILYPALRFHRLKPTLDPALEIIAEIATDAFNWRNTPGDTVEFSNDPLDATRDTVVIRSTIPTASETRQMLHLRFTLTP